MKAMILAGGKGTRLRPITCELPKPMVPVVNTPIMEHIILFLRKNNIKDIGVTLMYMSQKIKNYFGDGSSWGVHLTYFTEDTPRGTAGSILRAASWLDDTFVVLCGDCISDIDLEEAIRSHRLNGAIATLVLVKSDNPIDYGIVGTDSNGCITGFLEKPSRSQVFTNTVNTGIYILEPEVFKYIEPDLPFDFSRQLFPKLLKSGHPLFGHTSPKYWSDVGSLKSYLNTHKDILDRKAGSESRLTSDPRRIITGMSTVIEPTAVLNGPCVIGDNCYIGHGAVIDSYTVIGNNCFIENKAIVKRSILHDNVSVGIGSELRGSILGSRVRLMRHVSCYENTAVGSGNILHEYCRIGPNVRIWPGKMVDASSAVNHSFP